jgi:hypothetical protein
MSLVEQTCEALDAMAVTKCGKPATETLAEFRICIYHYAEFERGAGVFFIDSCGRTVGLWDNRNERLGGIGRARVE